MGSKILPKTAIYSMNPYRANANGFLLENRAERENRGAIINSFSNRHSNRLAFEGEKIRYRENSKLISDQNLDSASKPYIYRSKMHSKEHFTCADRLSSVCRARSVITLKCSTKIQIPKGHGVLRITSLTA